MCRYADGLPIRKSSQHPRWTNQYLGFPRLHNRLECGESLPRANCDSVVSSSFDFGIVWGNQLGREIMLEHKSDDAMIEPVKRRGAKKKKGEMRKRLERS